jgi:hypothetical protein
MDSEGGIEWLGSRWMRKCHPWSVGFAGHAGSKPITNRQIPEVVEVILIELVLPHYFDR